MQARCLKPVDRYNKNDLDPSSEHDRLGGVCPTALVDRELSVQGGAAVVARSTRHPQSFVGTGVFADGYPARPAANQ
jgi:hypothetical protein